MPRTNGSCDLCDQEADRFRRQRTDHLSLRREDGMDGWAGAGRLWGALGCEEGEGGRLMGTILYARCSIDRQTVHDIGEGSWQARPARPDQTRSDPTRPDQTRQTDFAHAHVCFVFGTERVGNACCPIPKLRRLQGARDLSRFVHLFRQDGRRRAGRAWSRAMRLACPHRARRWLAPTRDDGYTHVLCKRRVLCV